MADPDRAELGERALRLLQTIYRQGDWYVSAIELPRWLHEGEYLNGEELCRQAEEILFAAGLEEPADEDDHADSSGPRAS